MPSLTVFCPLGLSNRLRVLLSGLALAEASGRQFTMLWPITPACAAPCADLFANDWPVQTVAASAVAGLPYISGWFGHLPDLLAVPQADLVVGHPTWLIRPGEYPGHDRLMARCQSLFAELTPTSDILDSVDAFRCQYFRSRMIGVHLRRGDLLSQRPDVAHNTDEAIAAVAGFLGQLPEASILLCTDDGAVNPNSGRLTATEDVFERFQQRFGSRVVRTIPRSLDRRTPEAIQDALIDLWLLRATDCLVGTQGSSFSEMALFARDVPHRLVAGSTPGYQKIETLARRTGLYVLLSRLSTRQADKSPPFPALMRYYGLAPYRWIRQKARELLGR